MKLISITFGTVPRLPGLRPSDTGRIELDKPGVALDGWRAAIRGSQIYFLSPAGWMRDQSIKSRDPKGPVTAFGPVAVSEVYLEWALDSDTEIGALLAGKMQFETPPFGWKPAPVEGDKPILEQIPPGQMGDA